MIRELEGGSVRAIKCSLFTATREIVSGVTLPSHSAVVVVDRFGKIDGYIFGLLICVDLFLICVDLFLIQQATVSSTSTRTMTTIGHQINP